MVNIKGVVEKEKGGTVDGERKRMVQPTETGREENIHGISYKLSINRNLRNKNGFRR